jgi:hypothetical protein
VAIPVLSCTAFLPVICSRFVIETLICFDSGCYPECLLTPVKFENLKCCPSGCGW